MSWFVEHQGSYDAEQFLPTPTLFILYTLAKILLTGCSSYLTVTETIVKHVITEMCFGTWCCQSISLEIAMYYWQLQ